MPEEGRMAEELEWFVGTDWASQSQSIPVLALEAQNLPRDFRRGRPAEAQVPFRCSKHRIRGLLPAGRPGPASLQYRPANNRFAGYSHSNHRSRPGAY